MKPSQLISRAALLAAGLSGICAMPTAAAAPAPPAPTIAASTPPAGSLAQLVVGRADRDLIAHRPAVHADPADTFAVTRVVTDTSGASHVRYRRTFRGLPVRGGDIVVHEAPDGSYQGTSVAQSTQLSVSTTPAVAAATAASTARTTFSGTVGSVGSPQLIVDAGAPSGRLAWETVVSGVRADGQTPSALHVLTDARTGAVIGSHDDVETVVGTGNALYSGAVPLNTSPTTGGFQLSDPLRGGSYTCDLRNTTTGRCTPVVDADNVWGTGNTSSRQSAAVDAQFGAVETFDYYKTTFGRDGIFGDGRGVPSRVHYGNNFVNAYWDGEQMTYGDGDRNAKPLVALDVAGHEMSHGVSEALANLDYAGEAGGIDEATSDIFGTMVEFAANAPADPGDYTIGEKIDVDGTGKPLRYLFDPSLDGGSPNCWSRSVAAMDPHNSSGIGNHFFFLLAEGSGSTPYGTSPVCNRSPAVAGIGRQAAAAIWYHALDAYFTSSTKYRDTSAADNDARHYTLLAAKDLFGSCGIQYRAVQAAWTAVNVSGQDAVCG